MYSRGVYKAALCHKAIDDVYRAGRFVAVVEPKIIKLENRVDLV